MQGTESHQNKHLDDLYEEEAFRDKISTVDEHGKRVWLYPKKPSGWYYNARTVVSFLFAVIFLTLPFIKVNGYQFLKLDIIEREFILFGMLFTPQDFFLLGLGMITFLVFIILFTVVYGRLFCGWVCPQTVFMEMFFRRIEYAIEGDSAQQRRLDKGPWNAEKIRKKTLKHLIFFAIAVIVANYFLAYIIGMDEVLQIIRDPLSEHWKGFVAMIFFSFVFYFVFARLREQVCTSICPYGRMQGVLLVDESIVVAYDHMRGEPRGKIKKNAPADPIAAIQGAVAKSQGDCVDCNLCVAVCPTGIDIRNGTQLECTNCTACMDACDSIMEKVNRPTGLIRYDSKTGIETGRKKVFNKRVMAYSGVLLLLLGFDAFFLLQRGDTETIIQRAKGQTYQKIGTDSLSNLYTFTIINKTPRAMPIDLRLVDMPGARMAFAGPAPDSLPKGDKIQGAFTITMATKSMKERKLPLHFELHSNGKKIEDTKSSFLGPFQTGK